MKRAATPSWLISREIHWLSWWQELIINWVASWGAVGTLVVTSADRDRECSWDVPSDLQLARMKLEELISD